MSQFIEQVSAILFLCLIPIFVLYMIIQVLSSIPMVARSKSLRISSMLLFFTFCFFWVAFVFAFRLDFYFVPCIVTDHLQPYNSNDDENLFFRVQTIDSDNPFNGTVFITNNMNLNIFEYYKINTVLMCICLLLHKNSLKGVSIEHYEEGKDEFTYNYKRNLDSQESLSTTALLLIFVITALVFVMTLRDCHDQLEYFKKTTEHREQQKTTNPV